MTSLQFQEVGESLEIFDSPDIAEASLQLSCYFITAIGHKENVPLLQKVADKSFITPTALGQYFNEIYNETIAQLHNSKAKLVEDITKQLEANYHKQIENLNINLINVEKTSARQIEFLNQQLQLSQKENAAQIHKFEELEKEVKKKGQFSVYVILIIVAALIIGWIIGKLL